MDNRQSMRIPVYIEADIYSDGNSYAGFIGNLSESGLCVETVSAGTITDFIPGTILDLEFQHLSGKPLNLHCEVNWLQTRKNIPDGLKNSLGIKIIDPSPEFKEYFSSLH